MKRMTLTAGFLATAVLAAAPAWAFSPTELQILDCATGQSATNNVCNRAGQNTGPGIEQASHALVRAPDGKQYVVAVYMTSKVSRADRPYQCACTSIMLDPVRGPSIVADKIQLTQNRGNRPCNHPAISSNGDFMVWMYGTNDANQTNVTTYAQAIDHMCNVLTPDRVKISNDDNNNSAAPSIAFIRGTTWGGGYYVNGANKTHAVVLETARAANGQVSITETHDEVVVNPTNIGRPTSLAVGDKHMICAAQGNERPPEDGIRCALVDTNSGRAVWSQLIIEADNNSNPKKRYNMPNLALLSNNKVLVQFEQTNARGRDGNNNRQRGTTMTHVMALNVDPVANTVQTADHQMNIGVNQVHAGICAGSFGTMSGGAGAAPGTGFDPHVAIIDASITGSGIAAAQMLKWDAATSKIVLSGPALAVGSQAGDGGYLANIYGQNPNDQGREFLSCLGGVPNTGYHQPNGFRPEVKSFYVYTYGGMIPPGIKNSGFTAFYPAEVDTPVPPVQYPLAVSIAGAGKVTSSPFGISCSTGMCSARWDQNVVITLSAAPSAGSKFDGWSGDCNGSAQCVVRIDQARNVTATFSKIQGNVTPVALFIAYDGDGKGSIVSSPDGINCTAGCNANFDPNSMVALSATPDGNSKFVGWAGDCTGVADCTVTLDVEKHVTARFIAVQSGGGVSMQDPRGPDPRVGNGGGTNPGTGTMPTTPAIDQDHNLNSCSTTGSNAGALVPALLVIGLIGLIRRRNRR